MAAPHRKLGAIIPASARASSESAAEAQDELEAPRKRAALPVPRSRPAGPPARALLLREEDGAAAAGPVRRLPGRRAARAVAQRGEVLVINIVTEPFLHPTQAFSAHHLRKVTFGCHRHMSLSPLVQRHRVRLST